MSGPVRVGALPALFVSGRPGPALSQDSIFQVRRPQVRFACHPTATQPPIRPRATHRRAPIRVPPIRPRGPAPFFQKRTPNLIVWGIRRRGKDRNKFWLKCMRTKKKEGPKQLKGEGLGTHTNIFVFQNVSGASGSSGCLPIFFIVSGVFLEDFFSSIFWHAQMLSPA